MQVNSVKRYLGKKISVFVDSNRVFLGNSKFYSGVLSEVTEDCLILNETETKVFPTSELMICLDCVNMIQIR